MSKDIWINAAFEHSTITRVSFTVQCVVNPEISQSSFSRKEKFDLTADEFNILMDNFQFFRSKMGACAKLCTLQAYEEKTGFVYIMSAPEVGCCKIGVTRNYPEKRLVDLGAKVPFDVELVHVYAALDPYSSERLIHNKFENLRIRGEWFSGDASVFADDAQRIIEEVNKKISISKSKVMQGIAEDNS